MTLDFAEGYWSCDGKRLTILEAIEKDARCARISARYMLKLGLSIMLLARAQDYEKLKLLLEEYIELGCNFLVPTELFLIKESLEYYETVAS